jgi:hypothetical protein
MGLPRVVIVSLVVIWVVCFIAFIFEGVAAVGSGNSFEYKLLNVQFPHVAGLLLLCMATSSGLLWANYRNDDFRVAEQIVYSAFFGISVFGLMLMVPLVLAI